MANTLTTHKITTANILTIRMTPTANTFKFIPNPTKHPRKLKCFFYYSFWFFYSSS